MSDDARAETEQGGAIDDPVVRRVQALLDLVARHKLSELRLVTDDFRLRVRAGRAISSPPPLVEAETQEAPAAAPEAAEPVKLITAPMIGTLYLAPAPGEPPFVNVGDTIEVGQTVAIIEAMKIMNEIQSDQAGVLVEVLAANGQGVEFGQPLFRLQ